MIHLNRNLLCAIDIRVSGTKPLYHDLIQLAVIPLDAFLHPIKEITPFFADIIPRHPERLNEPLDKVNFYPHDKIHYIANTNQIEQVINDGFDSWHTVDLFEEWFQRLNLRMNKRIVPLAWDWRRTYYFISDWLGGIYNAEHFFDYHHRDLLGTAQFINDYYDHHIERIPYPKTYLQYLCSQLKIPRHQPTDALEDATYIAEIYRHMITDTRLKFPMLDQR